MIDNKIISETIANGNDPFQALNLMGVGYNLDVSSLENVNGITTMKITVELIDEGFKRSVYGEGFDTNQALLDGGNKILNTLIKPQAIPVAKPVNTNPIIVAQAEVAVAIAPPIVNSNPVVSAIKVNTPTAKEAVPLRVTTPVVESPKPTVGAILTNDGSLIKTTLVETTVAVEVADAKPTVGKGVQIMMDKYKINETLAKSLLDVTKRFGIKNYPDMLQYVKTWNKEITTLESISGDTMMGEFINWIDNPIKGFDGGNM